MIRLEFLGQSGFHIAGEGIDLLIDPFLSGNPLAKAAAEDFSPSHIIVTHGHGDHFGDTEAIARRSGAVVVSSAEIADYAQAQGLAGHGMNIGGGYDFPFGRLRFTPAWHSNSLPDGRYGGMPMGVILELAGKRIYHSGDTALFSDMSLIGRHGLDLALLPIGDNYTMGPEDALEAIRLLKPKRVVPMHYNTFDVIRQDARSFREAVRRETDAECTVLEPGESFELD
ncbi:MAG TPA: metal-dependent hydrolase [Trueperaceae bacterium]